jgi:hypothetical protein
VEEPWQAALETPRGAGTPRYLQVSRDGDSLKELIETLADLSPKNVYAVVPVLVVGTDGIRIGDGVRVVTPSGPQRTVGYVMEVNANTATVRFDDGQTLAGLPITALKVVSRRIAFPGGT